MSVVNINKNLVMFRANSSNGTMRGRSYAYFIFGSNAEKLVTNQYYNFEGNRIHEYKTSKELTLLDMGDVDTINYLKSIGNSNVVKSIEKTFRIRNGEVIRKSKLEHDLAVSRLICKMKGVDGYYAPPLKQKYGNKRFHQEIMLCLPENKVTYLSSKLSTNKPLKPLSKKTFSNSNYKFETPTPIKRPSYQTPPPVKKMKYNSYRTPSPIKMTAF